MTTSRPISNFNDGKNGAFFLECELIIDSLGRDGFISYFICFYVLLEDEMVLDEL